MRFSLDSHTYGSVRFSRSIPAAVTNWLIPGSQAFCAKGSFGVLLVQQVKAGGAMVYYTRAMIKKDLALDFLVDLPGCFAHIAMHNESRFEIEESDNFYMKQGQFNFLRAHPLKGTFYLEGGNEYRMLSIAYPLSYLNEMLPFFPYMTKFLQKDIVPGRTFKLFKNHCWIDTAVMDITEHLLQCHYRGSLRQLFFDYKVKEILFHLLEQESNASVIDKLNNHVIDAINEAKYIIEEGYGKASTLQTIARKVGMTEGNLRLGLKLLYGL